MSPDEKERATDGPRFDRVLLALTGAAFAARALLLLLEPRCEFVGDEASWVSLGIHELGRPRRGLSPFRVPLIFYPPLYQIHRFACPRVFFRCGIEECGDAFERCPGRLHLHVHRGQRLGRAEGIAEI